MSDKRWNTKLTSVEIRWIKNAYKEMKDKNPHTSFGSIRLTKLINEGREKAGMEKVHSATVNRAINKIKSGVALVPIDAYAKIVICPKCGHVFGNKKEQVKE